MTEFKGTPGKWRVDTYKGSDGEISEIYILKESGGCIICVNDGDDSYDIPTDLANAQLISAAPELLAALELLLYGWNNSDINHDVTESFNIAQAAVDKALNG